MVRKYFFLLFICLTPMLGHAKNLSELQQIVYDMQKDNNFYNLKEVQAYDHKAHYIRFEKLGSFSKKYNRYYMLVPSLRSIGKTTLFYVAGLYSLTLFQKLLKEKTCFLHTQVYNPDNRNILKSRLLIAPDQESCKAQAYVVTTGF